MSNSAERQLKPSQSDWNAIHALAWHDAEFRAILEADPRKAIDLWGEANGKAFDLVVRVAEPSHEDGHVPPPPACC